MLDDIQGTNASTIFNPLVCDGFGIDLNLTQLRFKGDVKRIQISITF